MAVCRGRGRDADPSLKVCQPRRTRHARKSQHGASRANRTALDSFCADNVQDTSALLTVSIFPLGESWGRVGGLIDISSCDCFPADTTPSSAAEANALRMLAPVQVFDRVL
jgi:hypothetical protein